MSANNWDTCPRCEKKRLADVAEKKKELKAQYGKVGIEEWNAAQDQLKVLEAQEPEESLREDYSIGIHEGKFVVSYRGDCQACDFRFEFRKEQKVEA